MNSWNRSDATGFLQKLHDEDGLSWIKILALLERINENTHLLSKAFDLHPVVISAIRRIHCEEQYVVREEILSHAMHQAFSKNSSMLKLLRDGTHA